MVLTIIIPQAPPINQIGEQLTLGTLYAVGDYLAEDSGADIIWEVTGPNDVTTVISLKTGLVYPSLPGNAVQLPDQSQVNFRQGNML